MDPIIIHIHPKITITIDGNKEVIPMNIGISPPLSPNNEPDEIDLADVLVQATQIPLAIGIIYLISRQYKLRKLEGTKTV